MTVRLLPHKPLQLRSTAPKAHDPVHSTRHTEAWPQPTIINLACEIGYLPQAPRRHASRTLRALCPDPRKRKRGWAHTVWVPRWLAKTFVASKAASATCSVLQKALPVGPASQAWGVQAPCAEAAGDLGQAASVATCDAPNFCGRASSDTPARGVHLPGHALLPPTRACSSSSSSPSTWAPYAPRRRAAACA